MKLVSTTVEDPWVGYVTHQNIDMLLVQRRQTGFQRITVT
jgi:hypothetical protein